LTTFEEDAGGSKEVEGAPGNARKRRASGPPFRMIFQETKLPGVFEIQLQTIADERGFFARTWCRDEFQAHGLSGALVQCSLSFNKKKGTLRGMHYQAAPHAEDKVVGCNRGEIYDVILDLRPHSPAFKNWIAIVLTAEKHNMVYVPEGCAHGFLTLADNCEVTYQMSEFFHAESARGIRWNDPAFQIQWPAKAEVISDRDRAYPDFKII
jgi:dTDP-4-dehydrorhamnose 3,5-epimerase